MAASRSIRRLAALLCTGLVLAACGPRFDVAELENATTGTSTVQVPLAGGQTTDDTTLTDPTTDTGTTTDDGGVTTPGAAPAAGGDAASGGQDTGSDTSGDTGGGSDQPADAGSDDGGGDTPSAPAAPAAGQDPGPAPGVSDEPCEDDGNRPVNPDLGCIKIGVLVPETGAAPVPSDFRAGVELYWYDKAEKGGTNGYQVQLEVRDTTSQPNATVTAAQSLVNEVFTIVSLDRLEVHEALGNFMERAGVPHIMVQAPTPAPASWTNTFIISIDHTVQGRAIAQYWASDLGAGNGAKPVGVVREQTSALKPGTDAFLAEAGKIGLDVVVSETINPSNTSFTPTVLSVCQSGADIVWLYMAPTPALTFMQQAAAQNCSPTWFANSISWNLDLAQSQPTAPARSGAFSPWVALGSSRASAYRAASQKYNDNNGEDLGLAAWGLNEVVDAALEAAGPAIGRDSFRRGLETLKVDRFDVWGPIDCTGGPPYTCSNSVAVYEDGGLNWTLKGDFRQYG